MFSIVMIIYNILFPILFILYFPFYRRKLEKRGNYKDGFDERFGKFTEEKKRQLAALNNPLWIHAVSVGETVAALSFINALKEHYPDLDIVLSTTTSTGQQIARKKVPEGVLVIYSPLDMAHCVNRSLSIIKPSMYIIFEVEIWPNIIRQCHRRKIPVQLVNCRVSDKSYAGFKKHKWFFSRIFAMFNSIAAQSKTDADRITDILPLNHPAPVICGTMKYDQVSDSSGTFTEINDVFDDNSLIFTAASIHPGEPEIMINAYQHLNKKFPELKMVLVPRHVEKIDYFCDVLDGAKLNYIRLSKLREGEKSQQADMLLVDTTGELMSILAKSDIVYVGKSLGGNQGGHNIIEPAIFGKTILFGKNMQNFRLVVDDFIEAGAAIEVEQDDRFKDELEKLIADKEKRANLADAARKLVDSKRGSIKKTIDLLKIGS